MLGCAFPEGRSQKAMYRRGRMESVRSKFPSELREPEENFPFLEKKSVKSPNIGILKLVTDSLYSVFNSEPLREKLTKYVK